MTSEISTGARARRLIRRAETATLASTLARDGSGRPYASLVLATVDHDASPILLLSDLADHSRNLESDDRLALLFDGAPPSGDPLAGPRVTVLGRAASIAEEAEQVRLRERIVRRHPGAAVYAGFTDFRLYRLTIESAHLVAGFGDVHWLEADTVRLASHDRCPLAEAEAGIVACMNADDVDALAVIGSGLTDCPAPNGTEPWTMVGIDPEGIDLRRGGRLARAAFDAPVGTPAAARTALKTLTDRTRARLAGGAAS